MIEVVFAFNALVLAYFVVANGFYVALSLLAMRRMRRHVRRQRSLDMAALVDASGDLPVSLIVPAYNEAQTIVPVVRSMLTLAYETYDIVVVNDGSVDATLERLTAAFDLKPAERVQTSSVPTAAIRGVYRSREHPNLWVVDKENGGGKADALNAGLNHSRTPLVCALDADTLLEPDSLVRVVRPFLEDATTVAAGGVIRVANGCTISGGMVTEVRLPRSLLARFQVVEYMRAFVAARVGWDAIGGTLIISGAFGVFRRSVIADAGGFDTATVGEDMELVMRLHDHLRQRGRPYRISFVPDPVAWTEAPESLSDLGRQRDRWQRGLMQVLWRHRRMFASPKHGVPGMVAFPFFLFVELLGPVVEVLGYAAFAATMLLGWGSATYAGAFVMVAVVLGSLISTFAVVLQELSFSRYRSTREVLALVGLAMVEGFGYRQLTLWWRMRGLISGLRRTTAWGPMDRKGFGDTVSLEPPAGEARAA